MINVYGFDFNYSYLKSQELICDVTGKGKGSFDRFRVIGRALSFSIKNITSCLHKPDKLIDSQRSDFDNPVMLEHGRIIVEYYIDRGILNAD